MIWIEKCLRYGDRDGDVKTKTQHWLVDIDGMIQARVREPEDDNRDGSWTGELDFDAKADRYFIDARAAKRWCEGQIQDRLKTKRAKSKTN